MRAGRGDGLETGTGLEGQRPGTIVGGDADAPGDRLGDLVEDQPQGGVRLGRHQRYPGSAAEAQPGVEGNLAHEGHAQLLGETSATAVIENLGALAAARAEEVA